MTIVRELLVIRDGLFEVEGWRRRSAVGRLGPVTDQVDSWPARADACVRQRSSGQVLPDETGHFKHRHLGLAHHRLKLGITKDVALVRGVLEIVQLDVAPQQFGDLGSRLGCGTYDSCELDAGCQGARERCLLLGSGHVWLGKSGEFYERPPSGFAGRGSKRWVWGTPVGQFLAS